MKYVFALSCILGYFCAVTLAQPVTIPKGYRAVTLHISNCDDAQEWLKPGMLIHIDLIRGHSLDSTGHRERLADQVKALGLQNCAVTFLMPVEAAAQRSIVSRRDTVEFYVSKAKLSSEPDNKPKLLLYDKLRDED